MSPELTDLLARAKALVDSWTPEEREEHFRIQRENMARAYRAGPRGATRVVVVQGPLPAGFDAPERSQPDFRTILMALVSALTLAEGNGDMMDAAWEALKLAGMEPPEGVDGDKEVREWLDAQGAPSLWRM